MAPGKKQSYGKDFVMMTVAVPPEERKQAKLKSVSYGISISELIRLALSDEGYWKKAAKMKQTAGK